MKKSITTLVVAIFATFNGANAADLSNTDTKLVSSADPSLISTELGNLKKHTRTIDEIIASDLKVTEGVMPSKKPAAIAKKKSKKAQIKLKKQFNN
jgi:hypothetical protein